MISKDTDTRFEGLPNYLATACLLYYSLQNSALFKQWVSFKPKKNRWFLTGLYQHKHLHWPNTSPGRPSCPRMPSFQIWVWFWRPPNPNARISTTQWINYRTRLLTLSKITILCLPLNKYPIKTIFPQHTFYLEGHLLYPSTHCNRLHKLPRVLRSYNIVHERTWPSGRHSQVTNTSITKQFTSANKCQIIPCSSVSILTFTLVVTAKSHNTPKDAIISSTGVTIWGMLNWTLHFTQLKRNELCSIALTFVGLRRSLTVCRLLKFAMTPWKRLLLWPITSPACTTQWG